VDVVDNDIVPARGCHYLALSYVWGTVANRNAGTCTISHALRSNMSWLTQPRVLDEAVTVLPRTFRDATGLTERLRERYL
jgi:hypothetical protein